MAIVGRAELLILGMICLISLILLVVGVVFAWAIRRDRVACPYCAERIRRDARICRYCGREVGPPAGGEREQGSAVGRGGMSAGGNGCQSERRKRNGAGT